jgi:hypothetical protein
MWLLCCTSSSLSFPFCFQISIYFFIIGTNAAVKSDVAAVVVSTVIANVWTAAIADVAAAVVAAIAYAVLAAEMAAVVTAVLDNLLDIFSSQCQINLHV